MHIIYYHSTDMKTLARQLMAYSEISEEAAMQLASEGINRIDHFPIPLQPEGQWPTLPEDQIRIIRYRMHRLITAINQSYPLLEGETIERDGYLATYLAKDYFDYPAGTIVVHRQSSFGDIYFMDSSFSFNGEAILGDPHPEVNSLLLQDNMTIAGAFSWGDLAIDIAKSLAGAVVGKIGSSIFDELFPAGVPPYFDAVYAQFEKIINKSIAENKRKEMSAAVLSIQDGMRTYNRIKMDPPKRKESQDMLSTLWNESRILTNTIKEFNEVGLGLFAVAGGLHLAILQERALTDPDHTDPNTSPWAKDLIAKATEFKNWGNDTRYNTIKTRGDAITEVKLIQKSSFVPGAGPVDSSYYIWEDKLTGERFTYNKRESCCDSNPHGTAKNERQKRWDETVVVMTNNLQPLVVATDNWNKLTAQPLPLPSGK